LFFLFVCFVFRSGSGKEHTTMYQQTTVVGNLGSTPEMRYTPNGIPVTNFSVAVNEKYGETESTIWFRVACWRQLAEVTSQYLSKGRQVFITGRISARPYLDRDGNPAVSLELTADTIKFLGRPDNHQGPAQPTNGAAQPPNGAAPHTDQPPIPEEDIPF
jgi:single-strand DNA-binding protein